MADESVRLNLGVLRSDMSLTLHTHHASRVWHGRVSNEKQHGIIGLSGFVGIMNRMKRGSEQDDPYSDWWMIRMEDKLAEVKAKLQQLRELVNQALAFVPGELTMTENLNVQPVKLPLYINAQLGFMAVYLLTEYDTLVRKVLLAHHIAMIDRTTMESWLDDGAHSIRSLFSLAQHYQYSGAARDDFAANNAKARAALEKLGPLPQEVMEGTRRSRFAPPRRRQSGLGAQAVEDEKALDPDVEALEQEKSEAEVLT
jgi:integrating conjugative element protein (TIGR03761 family)